jgi:hypothetical protein
MKAPRPTGRPAARLGAALRKLLATYHRQTAAAQPWPDRPLPGSEWEALAEARLTALEAQLAGMEKQMAGQNRLLLLTLVSIVADVLLTATR